MTTTAATIAAGQGNGDARDPNIGSAPPPTATLRAAGRSAAAYSPSVSGEQMRMVLDISRLLAVATDLDLLLCRIAEAATVLLDCERASIFLHDSSRNELWSKVAIKSGEIRVPCHLGIVGHSFNNNEILNVLDPYSDPRFNSEPDRRTGFVTRNLLTAPMVDLDGKPLGVIQAVNKKIVPFSENDTALVQLLAEQAGVAIQRHRLQCAAIEIEGLRHEMDLARRAQEALIPKSPPDVRGLESAGWTLPASITGGDCFDLWKLPDGRMGILLADASGHGLAPALVVSQARTLVRTISEIEPEPHRLLQRVNARLCEDLEWGQFVTAFVGFLSPDGALHWSSAGHGPSFLRPRCGEKLEVLDPPVQPLGVLAEWMDGAPPPAHLEQTGSLILVSDGIFEACDAAGKQFGIDRMVALLDAQPETCKPHEVVAELRAAVRNWHGSNEPFDDQTILVVQREGREKPPRRVPETIAKA